jgi:antitoxin component YwqK of YwqJK toxin-antitoxin module
MCLFSFEIFTPRKMLKSILLFSIMLVTSFCFAQRNETLYFDAKNQKCIIDSAEYYSIGERFNGHWIGQVNAFFMTGEKKQTSFYDFQGDLEGERTSFYKNGNIKEIENFIGGRKLGV